MAISFPVHWPLHFAFWLRTVLHFQFYLWFAISPIIFMFRQVSPGNKQIKGLPLINSVLLSAFTSLILLGVYGLVWYKTRIFPQRATQFSQHLPWSVRPSTPTPNPTPSQSVLRYQSLHTNDIGRMWGNKSNLASLSEHPYLWTPVLALGTRWGQGPMTWGACVSQGWPRVGTEGGGLSGPLCCPCAPNNSPR